VIRLDGFRVIHLTKKNQVVASLIDLHGFAFHDSERILDQRHSKAALKVNACGTLGIFFGEHARDIFLMFGQDVDAEMLRILEPLKTAEPEIQADEDKDRI
jgi:hypothetical protein